MVRHFALLTGLTLVCALRPAGAAGIIIINPSFEDPALGCTPPAQGSGTCSNNGPITGWNEGSQSYRMGVFKPGTYDYPYVPDGVQVAYTLQDGSIGQVLNATLVPDTTYTLTVMVGTLLGSNGAYALRLAAGNHNASAEGFVPLDQGPWVPVSVGFTTSHNELAFQLVVSLGDGNFSSPQYYDDLRLDASPLGGVPEPATWWMVGAAGLLALRSHCRVAAKRVKEYLVPVGFAV